MIKKKYIFTGIGLIFLVGIMIFIIPSTDAEVILGEDDLGRWFLFPRILPSQMITVLENNPLIDLVIIHEVDKLTQVYYNLTGTGITLLQLEEYLNEINSKIEKLEVSMAFFPGVIIPDECKRSSFNNSKVFGYYTLNDGSEFIQPEDSFCLEVLANG